MTLQMKNPSMQYKIGQLKSKHTLGTMPKLFWLGTSVTWKTSGSSQLSEVNI
uniref:Alternative protein RAB3C n=1 Tax=Homo sapiens TaxID=9606 RepID=L8E952_HUMAN|nr:alternative protein RAB3C [Homo sapiens]